MSCSYDPKATQNGGFVQCGAINNRSRKLQSQSEVSESVVLHAYIYELIKKDAMNFGPRGATIIQKLLWIREYLESF